MGAMGRCASTRERSSLLRAGSWSLRALRHESDCGPLVRYICNIDLIMVALWNRADHYIFILSFVLLLFFLA